MVTGENIIQFQLCLLLKHKVDTQSFVQRCKPHYKKTNNSRITCKSNHSLELHFELQGLVTMMTITSLWEAGTRNADTLHRLTSIPLSQYINIKKFENDVSLNPLPRSGTKEAFP